MCKNNLKIYLAGAMSGLTFEEMNEWRIEIKKQLEHMADYQGCNVNVVNPVAYYNFVRPQHKSEREVMQYDLNHVSSSDLVIVNLEHLDTSIGTIIELYEAHTKNIPVLAFGSDTKYFNLHPWIKECITRVDNSENEITYYIKNFYLS